MSEQGTDDAGSPPEVSPPLAVVRSRVTHVLDASAVLCLINDEPGAERVAAVLPSSAVSAVNLAEVASKLGELGAGAEAARDLLAPLHLAVVAFDERSGFATGALRVATRRRGLSLGDRACLALAADHGATALTTDKAWAEAGEAIGVPVEMLR